MKLLTAHATQVFLALSALQLAVLVGFVTETYLAFRGTDDWGILLFGITGGLAILLVPTSVVLTLWGLWLRRRAAGSAQRRRLNWGIALAGIPLAITLFNVLFAIYVLWFVGFGVN